MAQKDRLVMQVTITELEFPGLFQDLCAIARARPRVSRLLRLASIGWLVEQGRLGAPPAQPAA